MSDKNQSEESPDPLKHVKNQISEQFKKAFNDLLVENLKSDTPNVEWLKKLYTELRDRICGLTPRRHDLIKEIHETMDVDFFGQLVENTVFDNKSLYGLVDYIFTKIKQLEAPIKNKITDQKFNEILEVANKDDASMATIIPVFLANAHERLDDVYADRDAFLEFMKNKK
jgi:hypothetical protein